MVSPAGANRELPAEALIEIQTEIDRLKSLGKTNVELTHGGLTPTTMKLFRSWSDQLSAEEYIVFLNSIHTKYNFDPLIEAHIELIT
jgi:hypothetical protein